MSPSRITTSLSLSEQEARLLRSVVSFASESETYAEDDDLLARLYDRLDTAVTRLANVRAPRPCR